MPIDFIDNLSKIVFALFPPLDSGNIKLKSQIDCRNKLKPKIDDISNSNIFQYHFPINKIQKQLNDILKKKNTSISKILNTQAFSLKDLKRTFVVDKIN